MFLKKNNITNMNQVNISTNIRKKKFLYKRKHILLYYVCLYQIPKYFCVCVYIIQKKKKNKNENK